MTLIPGKLYRIKIRNWMSDHVGIAFCLWCAEDPQPETLAGIALKEGELILFLDYIQQSNLNINKDVVFRDSVLKFLHGDKILYSHITRGDEENLFEGPVC